MNGDAYTVSLRHHDYLTQPGGRIPLSEGSMIDTKYGEVFLENKPEVPEDEPCFLLRAQDELAADVIRVYGSMLFNKTKDAETLRLINKEADRFDAWPVKKIPD